jgi:hypothetical protein
MYEESDVWVFGMRGNLVGDIQLDDVNSYIHTTHTTDVRKRDFLDHSYRQTDRPPRTIHTHARVPMR